MKILFICENYIPHYGGAEVVFKNLAEGYVKQGNNVTILTHQLPGTKRKEMIHGVKVIRVPSFHSRYLFTFLAIPKAIRLAKRHDVIQTTSFNGAPPAWLAAKLTNKAVTITVHEVWIGKWRQVTSFGWLKRFIHDTLERMIYLLPFDKYVCVSNSTRKDLIAVKPRIKRKTEVIYNGVDYNFWNPNVDKKDIRKVKTKLNITNKFTYFSWGRPGESKGFEYVIKAVPLIKKQLPNSKFLLMLSGEKQYEKKRAQLRGLIKKLHLEKEIRLLQSVPHGELRSYLKAVDCAVIPSVAEGFGFNALEANTLGVPVVISNAGSLPEVVSGKYLLFENKNVKDLAEKVLLVAQGKYKNEEVRRFEWEDSITKYLSVYKSLTLEKVK
jgi:glycosyltransferase involved in cell wall biosynthesis